MAQLSYRGRKRLSEARSTFIEAFDSRVLEDWMHSVDDGDDLVYHYAEAIANAECAADEADERYGWDDDTSLDAGSAVGELTGALEMHLEALVAEICATVAQREGEWTEYTDDEEIEPAVHEAREWLQEHQDAAERAGVWEEVSA
ncbi:hypothetical protein [Natronorubrum halophilum]|uniref:hypothetical protein n=1 Tax=Natronorubrum halophilum TaxID=1702106 RepID=UPI000EF7034E|nr:hypothetical protein [Natronorubrum halophilum]